MGAVPAPLRGMCERVYLKRLLGHLVPTISHNHSNSPVSRNIARRQHTANKRSYTEARCVGAGV